MAHAGRGPLATAPADLASLHVPELIRRKRDGGALKGAELAALVAGYTDGRLPDYQAAALLMAIFFRGLDGDELAAFTSAMLHSGDVLDLSSIAGAKVDKHSTGGVGDMISIALAPLVACCGVVVPMISGRGLGHTGGTLDKLEAIPGFRTQLDNDRFRAQLERIGCAMIGQTERLAPADRKLYALRDVTGTVESIPLIASSIMSKKLAEGIDALVLDVKVGSGAFMKTRARARALAETLRAIGLAANKRVTAFLTDMDQPLGTFVGNALEVREAIRTLSRRGSSDVMALTLALAREMLLLGGAAKTEGEAQERLDRAIDSGAALERFAAIVEAQGGDPRAVLDESRLPAAPDRELVFLDREGVLSAIDAEGVGLAALALGAGRSRKEDAIDPAVGVELLAKVGARVGPPGSDRPFAALHHRGGRGVDRARARLRAACTVVDTGAARVAQPRAPDAPDAIVLEVVR